MGSVTAVHDAQSLEKHLINTQCDLCIVVVDDREQILPSCITHYPDMPVLVLTVSRKTGKLHHWFQQGATDVVSLQKPAAAQHAISRLIDECVSKQNQKLLTVRNQQLEQELAYLRSMINSDKRSFAVTASNENLLSKAERVEVSLKRMKQPVVENIIENYKARDLATGLPARTSVLDRFQKMLHSEIKAPRFTAMLVRILSDNNKDEKVGADKTVQDLTLYRAADALQKRLAKGTIMGRINQNALLLIQSSDDEPVSRDAANRVRDTLGTLGGLIDADTDVHINTMNLPAKTKISADEVVERLEALS